MHEQLYDQANNNSTCALAYNVSAVHDVLGAVRLAQLLLYNYLSFKN